MLKNPFDHTEYKQISHKKINVCMEVLKPTYKLPMDQRINHNGNYVNQVIIYVILQKICNKKLKQYLKRNLQPQMLILEEKMY